MVFFAQKVAHFVFFYYLCARKIGDVHQLAADVDYFADTRMLRTLQPQKNYNIQDKDTNRNSLLVIRHYFYVQTKVSQLSS